MPRTALGCDLQHAALEGSAMPVKEQGRKRAHRVRGNVAEHGATEFDRDGLRVIGVVALGHELQSVTGLEIAQNQRTIVVLEPGDMERDRLRDGSYMMGLPSSPAPRLASAAAFMA